MQTCCCVVRLGGPCYGSHSLRLHLRIHRNDTHPLCPCRPAHIIHAKAPGHTVVETGLVGICSRTPEVQNAIIETLGIASCRVITIPELYRIRELYDSNTISAETFKPGDFAGLVNLRKLSLRMESPPPAGLFAGLSRLQTLEVGWRSDVRSHRLEEGVFSELTGLESLNISVERRESHSSDYYLTITAGALEGLDNLRHLEAGYMGPMAAGALDGLSRLEYLNLSFGYDPNEERSELVLPSRLLANLPSLRDMDLRNAVMPEIVQLHNLDVVCELRFDRSGSDQEVTVNGRSVVYVEEYYDSEGASGCVLMVGGERVIRALPQNN